MTYRTMLLFTIWTTLCGAAHAASDSGAVGCPDRIDVRQELTGSVEGWTAILDDTPHRLAGITFYDGPPKDNASLVYDQRTKAAEKEIAKWQFLPARDRQIWLACSYAGTAIVLAKALPAKTSTCSVTYNPRQLIAGFQVIEKIDCK
jgi:hypothetical protein